MSEKYEVVIGLEVHVQLRTRSKLFAGAPAEFGAAPNHNVTPLCLALPGALPVLNARAVALAVRAGLATQCTVNAHSVFARKNYFYPDLPKGYQISQFEEPLCSAGHLDVDGARIRITRIHMEEDAGKSLHESARESAVDLNRAGVPLIEVVFEPDLRSAAQAVACLKTLREILRYAEVTDGDMEKGQFRCDANVSLRPHGARELGTRREIKNLNSFRFAAAAIEREVAEQSARLAAGEKVEQATLGYDAQADRIYVMRSKENADDYRYFPDPDLLPLQLSEARIEEIRAALPELPDKKRARFESEFALTAAAARALCESRALADWFETTTQTLATAGAAGDGDGALADAARVVHNWVARDVLGALSERGADADAIALRPEDFAALLCLVRENRVTTRNAREMLGELLWSGGSPEALLRERGLEAVADAGELDAQVARVIEQNPEAAREFAAGNAKALNFLMGQVMRETQGRADPGEVRARIKTKLTKN